MKRIPIPKKRKAAKVTTDAATMANNKDEADSAVMKLAQDPIVQRLYADETSQLKQSQDYERSPLSSN